MSALILALDIGTSSTRTALFDETAQRLVETTAQQSYALITSSSGEAELDPAVLLSAVRLCLEETLQTYRDDAQLRGRKIIGVGVSCFWHSLIGCNASGEPLTNIITWADSRCREDAADLREKLSEKKIHASTGCMLRASFWPAKLTWLRRTQRKLFQQVAQWMSPAEWLQLKLGGDANCALGMATGTGLFDPSKLKWHAPMLETCRVEASKFRRLSDEPASIGGELAKQFPELRGVPWFPGIGDGATSNLGSGATRPGFAAINVGTSAALRVMRQGTKARAPFGLFCYRVDAERYLVGGAVSNAGNLRAWCLRELSLPDAETIEERLAADPGPTHRLAVLPFWTAERAPFWNEDDRGAIHGITQHTTAIDLLQAITEATYHRLALIAEPLLANEKRAPKIIVSGGIQKSPASVQRLANVLGQAVYPNDEPEASIRGAAIYVLEKLGVQNFETKLDPPVRPQSQWAKAFASERLRHRSLEKLLKSCDAQPRLPTAACSAACRRAAAHRSTNCRVTAA